MNRLLLSALLIFLAISTFAQITSPIEITTKDGRTVILKPDGTWEFKKVVPQPSPTPVINSSKTIETSDSLPVNFAGQGIDSLHAKLFDLKTRLTKSEFETTAQYEKRAIEEIQKPITGNLTVKDSFSIVVPRVEAEYNADTQKMRFSLSVWENIIQPSGDVQGKKTARNLEDFNLYRIIWRDDDEIYGLYFDELNNLALTGKGFDSKFIAEVSLEVEEAKRLKNTVKAAVLVKFVEPYAINGYSTYRSFEKQFQVSLIDVYFFEPQTGKILAKMSGAKK